MKTRILEDLWYGNIEPMELVDYRKEEYRELLRLFVRNEENLLHTLSDVQKESFQKVKDISAAMEALSQCSAFVEGFRLGVQVMVAAGRQQKDQTVH